MKHLFFFSLLTLLISCGSVKKSNDKIAGTYNVSCGKCNYEMTGDGCDLGIEINGKFYYVEGSDLHDHGDAHAADGLCNVRREATVVGEIKNGVFVAESLELLPYEK